MTGSYRVYVEYKQLRYDFVIRRNITIIQGDSGTGKTTLISIIRDYMDVYLRKHRSKSKSSIKVVCDVPCVGFVSIDDDEWQEKLEKYSDSIVFLDGDTCEFTRQKEFADFVKNSSNYYVIATRHSLKCMSYSPQEIYELICVKKHVGTKEVFENHFNRLYRSYNSIIGEKLHPQNILTEDSGSGYQFFDNVKNWKKSIISCESTFGNGNVSKYIIEGREGTTLIVADGAAFGPYMREVMDSMREIPGYALFLPESFECLLLESGIVDHIVPNREKIVENTFDYVDSSEFFSWERYFAHVLITNTTGTSWAYNKSTLNPLYSTVSSIKAVLEVMKKSNIEIL